MKKKKKYKCKYNALFMNMIHMLIIIVTNTMGANVKFRKNIKT